MRRYLTFIALVMSVLLLLIASGCGTDNVSTSNNMDEIHSETEPESIVSTLDLTDSEQNYISKLKERGVLKAAIREVASVYREENGFGIGFNYSAIRGFTDDIGIDLELQIVDSIEAYFRKNGLFKESVKSNDDLVYNPDLFEEVDVYTDMLTQLPWREKLMDFIGFIPIRELSIYRSDQKISSVYDLNNKTIAVQSASSYTNTFEDVEKQYGLNFNYYYTDTIQESLNAVNDGFADITIMDSNRAFMEAKQYPDLEIGIPLSDVKFVGWAVSRENNALKSILEKYLNALIDSGEINELWLIDYDISFYEYYKLILKDAGILETMNLSLEEELYLNVIRESGQLNVAMQENVVGYAPGAEEQSGYNYLLARDLANLIGVKLEITTVDHFTKYFWLGGETPDQIKEDPGFTYIPDLMNTVDIYCDNLTHLEWRKRIFNQIEAVPVSTVIVQKVGSGISEIKDLDGLTIALNRDTSYEGVLSDLITTYDLNIEIMEVLSDAAGYEAVQNGIADITIIDSDIGFLFLKQYEDLEIVLQASESAYIGWAVKKEDEILASIVTKYIESMKQNGMFDLYWERTYGVSYPEYMRLLID